MKYKDFSRTLKLTEVYSMDSIRAIFNVYFSDDSTVLLQKKLNMTIISKCSLGNILGRLKGHVDKKHDDNNDVRQSISTFQGPFQEI